MNRKQRRKLKKMRDKNGGKKGSNPYFVASGGFKVNQGGSCHAEKGN